MKINNDIHDRGETLLPNIKFSLEGANSEEVSDENGIAYITNLPTNQPYKIFLRQETLTEPFWISKRSKTKVTSHPGGIMNLEFPISPSGEIEGTVSITQNG